MTTPQQIAQSLLSRPPPPLIPTKPYSQTLKSTITLLSSSSQPPTAANTTANTANTAAANTTTQEPPTTTNSLLIAALHLANDDIESCHDIVGNREDGLSKVLHAILHRREGDYWNSKYWINQTTHPLRPSSSFIDECEQIGKGKSKDGRIEKRQWDEIGRVVQWVLDGRE